MPMTIPSKRPGAALFPEDRARQMRRGQPDASGTTAGIGWAAWRESTLPGQPGYVTAVLVGADGPIKQRRRDAHGGGHGQRLYHSYGNVEEVEWACIAHAYQEAERPLQDLQSGLQLRRWWETLREYHDRVELDRVDVETFHDEDGAHHRIRHS